MESQRSLSGHRLGPRPEGGESKGREARAAAESRSCLHGAKVSCPSLLIKASLGGAWDPRAGLLKVWFPEGHSCWHHLGAGGNSGPQSQAGRDESGSGRGAGN